jgi:hypothetical protein
VKRATHLLERAAELHFGGVRRDPECRRDIAMTVAEVEAKHHDHSHLLRQSVERSVERVAAIEGPERGLGGFTRCTHVGFGELLLAPALDLAKVHERSTRRHALEPGTERAAAEIRSALGSLTKMSWTTSSASAWERTMRCATSRRVVAWRW